MSRDDDRCKECGAFRTWHGHRDTLCCGPIKHVFVEPAQASDAETVDAIGEAWMSRAPNEVPMGGMIGRVFGAAREAYAAGRKAAFKECLAIVKSEFGICDGDCDGECQTHLLLEAIAARAKEGSR